MGHLEQKLDRIIASLDRMNGASPAAREILSLKQAAEYLGISESTLREWVQERRIPFYRDGQKFVRFSRSKLNRWLERHEVPARD